MASSAALIETFLVFCRVAGCLMLVPGLSSARVPMRVRLYLAMVLSLAVGSFGGDGIDRPDRAGPNLVVVILSESVIGASIGLISRLLIEAIEFAGTTMSHYIGLSGIAGSIDGDEPVPAVANIVTLLATALLLILELPHVLIFGLVSSLQEVPVGSAFETDRKLRSVLEILGAVFGTALQISAPFLIYGMVLNVMFAVLGRLVPQISSYFISIPLIAIGGLILLYVCIADVVDVLSVAVRRNIMK